MSGITVHVILSNAKPLTKDTNHKPTTDWVMTPMTTSTLARPVAITPTITIDDFERFLRKESYRIIKRASKPLTIEERINIQDSGIAISLAANLWKEISVFDKTSTIKALDVFKEIVINHYKYARAGERDGFGKVLSIIDYHKNRDSISSILD